MKRDLEAALIDWKDSEIRMPLLLRGARQVGKTHIVRTFGRGSFQNLIEINFEESPEFKACFKTLHPNEIINAIELLSRQSIQPGQDLLFLDEVQECPEAIMALRYFKEKIPELHVIAAGSLLEFALNDASFRMPVGRVQSLYLRPLSFEEYLDAMGYQKMRAYLKLVSLEQPPSEAVHAQLLKLVREYVALGGMPAVVDSYSKNKRLRECQTIQTALLTTYRNDFGKYAGRAQIKHLQTVFSKTPGLVSRVLKYSHLDSDTTSRDLKQAIESLCQAGILNRSFMTNASALPLFSGAKESKFKLFFLDVGLVNRALLLDTELLATEDFMLLNQGAIAEQYVSEELLAYHPADEAGQLFYWDREKKGSEAEVDFVLTLGTQIIPVEVKSGATGRLKSIRVFMTEKGSKYALRISTQPLGLDRELLSIPFYLIGQWRRLLK